MHVFKLKGSKKEGLYGFNKGIIYALVNELKAILREYVHDTQSALKGRLKKEIQEFSEICCH